jgi:hypothetical protein
MPDEFITLVTLAVITVVVTLLWAATVAFTFWDLHRRGVRGGETLAWLAVVGLAPLLGFAAYALFRALTLLRPASRPPPRLPVRRETALKRPAAGPGRSSTLLASDVAMHTIADARQAEALDANLRSGARGYAFVVAAGPDQGAEFFVRHFPAQIGRGAGAAIRLEGDLGVSRKQAELYVQMGMLRIRDLHSTHGTQVNRRPIADQALVPGDEIQVGRSTLVVTKVED